MKTIEKKIDSTIIGKNTYDFIFTKIKKVEIKHKHLETYGKDEPLCQDSTVLMVTLLLIEEVNKMYSICEDKEAKYVLERAIIKLYQRINGGGNNGRKRNKGRSNKKYNKN